MSPTVYIAMFGWVPVVLALFASLPARRAVVTSFLVAWLFLPMAGFPISGLPDYTKMSATCLGVLLGAAIFDSRRLLAFRPSWADIPIAIWCLCPIVTSVKNGLGVYDGLSTAFTTFVSWGLPYIIGRMYFADLEGLRALAVGVFVGGLLYIPLCLFEIKMSPQLHKLVYGYHQHAFMQTKRFGGWRPMVFMQHGLMVGMWMTAATLCGVWLWKAKAIAHVSRIHVSLLAPSLGFTALLCKSLGAAGLMVIGLATLWVSSRFRTRMPLVLLASVPLLYAGARLQSSWTGDRLVSMVGAISAERAQSFGKRLSNEELLIDRAMRRRWWGWGGHSRSHVVNESGKNIAVTDGLWIIALGQRGRVGLAAIMATTIVPGLLILRCPARRWAEPAYAGAAALAVIMLLYSIDNLMNAMVNPIFMLGAGGLTSVFATRRSARAAGAGVGPTRAPARASGVAGTAAALAGRPPLRPMAGGRP